MVEILYLHSERGVPMIYEEVEPPTKEDKVIHFINIISDYIL